jgi:putative ABC transport system permease protein
MTTLWQDVLYGLRVLANKPGFTAIAVLSLGLGIGANTAIFSLVNTILLGSLSFREPGRLVMIETTPPGHPEQTNGAMVPDYIAWQGRSRSFEKLGAISGDGRDLGTSESGAPAERIEGEGFSPAMFQLLGVRPTLGRTFTDEEDQIDTPAPVILISHRLWKRRFASDPNIINKTVRADRATVTIIGVMPPDFRFWSDDADFWAPLRISRFQLEGSGPYLRVVGRLKPGVSILRAQAEMENIANQLARDFPTRNKGRGVRVEPIRDALFGWMRQPLWMLQGVVAFVLLIACANVAGLLLVRASSRQTEVAVRAALGASRSRIVRQLLTESMLLSFFGGALGALLAWVSLQMLIAISPPWFPRLHEISVDARVLAFTAALSVATGFAFGVIPALQMSKSNLAESLKESVRGSSTGLARQRFRGALTAGQIALALVLLVGAGLMINSFLRLEGADLGCDPTGLVTFTYILSGDDYVKPIGSYHNYPLVDVSPVPALTFDRLYQRILAVPGVRSAAGSVWLPLTGGENMTFIIEGRPKPVSDTEKNALSAMFFPVTANLFSTLKAPLLRGRDFTARDTASAPWVTIINQTMARTFWPNENPMGKHVTLALVPEERPREIIGVVRDIKADRYETKPQPAMYVPHAQMPLRYRGPYQWTRVLMSFVVRPAGDLKSVIPSLRRVVTEIDPNRPLGDFRSMEQVLGEQVQESRYYTLLLGIFAGVATALAMVGIYGVMAYSVAQRTREIGIRMALGAGRGDVLKLVLRHSLLLIGLGLVVGLGGSLALTRFIASQLWGISATDPATFVIVSLLLVLVALMATFIPARRASRVDPMVALRYE